MARAGKNLDDLLSSVEYDDDSELKSVGVSITPYGQVELNLDENENENEMSKHELIWDGWSFHEGKYVPTITKNFVKKVRPGVYTVAYSDQLGYFLQNHTYVDDEVIDLPIKEIDYIKEDIGKFWATKKDFEKYQMTYKRGILLYGQPGCGKTYAIKNLTRQLIEDLKGIVIKIESSRALLNFSEFASSIFRIIEPSTPVIVTMEDIDTIIEGHEAQSALLNLLDGASKVDNIVYVATTNYPERIPPSLWNRPSRFDRRYELQLPNDDVRRVYFEKKISKGDLKQVNIEKWVKDTNGFTVAHLKELIVSVMIFGNSFENSLETLKKLAERASSSQFKTMDQIVGKSTIGFVPVRYDESQPESGG